jgi:hypothetical protein
MPRANRLLPAWLPGLVVAWTLQAGVAQAQLPSATELSAALASSAAQAHQAGLVWRTHLLWVEALRQRSPMVAAHHQGVCHLGFSAYTPGRDYRWLFPALTPPQRTAWLAGVVHHELAHCAEQAAAGASGQALAASARQQEVLADLAFALQVDADADGDGLVALLASLRSRQAKADPAHDTGEALHCYLRLRGRFQPAGNWLSRLQAWRGQCGTPGAPEPDPPHMAAAWAGPGEAQTSSPQPVATRR